MSPVFLDWLETHNDKFKTYSISEIAELARLCGFDPIDIEQWKSRERFRKAV